MDLLNTRQEDFIASDLRLQSLDFVLAQLSLFMNIALFPSA